MGLLRRLALLRNFISPTAAATRGTDNARYCYSVWMRHLCRASNLPDFSFPRTVLELGPGDSIGTGLAALLSGADIYIGLDAFRHVDNERNLAVFDTLIELFRNREDIPGDEEFPRIRPKLDSYAFPRHLLSDAMIDSRLQAPSLEKIRHGILNPNQSGGAVHYMAPWKGRMPPQAVNVDMVFSQAVLQLVNNLPRTYQAIYACMSGNGIMSHQIDLGWYLSAGEWNQHLAYSAAKWMSLRAQSAYTINPARHSDHIRAMEDCGFRVLTDEKYTKPSNLRPDQLSHRFQQISQDDLTCCGFFVQAGKSATIPATRSDQKPKL